jgi:phosphatidylglycerol---prolipoprotein diacylglyceryl transferase
MELMAIPFPDIDPVAIVLGPMHIRWYGLAYLTGLIQGWLYMRRLPATPELWRGVAPMKPAQVDDFLLWATLGTVIGGRLGFIFLTSRRYFSTTLRGSFPSGKAAWRSMAGCSG